MSADFMTAGSVAPQQCARPVQWFGRGGVEAAGLHSYNSNLIFMGPLTVGLGGPWADFAHYANDC